MILANQTIDQRMVDIGKGDINHIKEQIKDIINLNIKKKELNKMIEEVIHLYKIVKMKATREENSITDKLMNFKTMDLLLFRKNLMCKTIIINMDIKENNMVIKKELLVMYIDRCEKY
jgi:hypothetical protein